MMTNLLISKVLNTKEFFVLNGKRCTPIMVDPDDATRYKCVCVDASNGSTIDSIPIISVPNTFQQFIYMISNYSVFPSGSVIFAYVKTPEEIREMYGIVNVCNPNCITFVFKDTGAEIRTQMLTAKQISSGGITIMVYDKPTIG